MQIGFWVLGLSWVLVGCGGRVIDDSGAGTVASGGSAPSGKAGVAGKAGTSQPPTRLPSKELGECVPGFVHTENPDRPCRWLTVSGLCFEKTDDACACICPTDRDSVCAHGFDGGPNGGEFVFCD